MDTIINAGIQVVPLHLADPDYTIVDKAIEAIKATGLDYLVTPFETVVNGTMPQLFELIAKLRAITEEAGADEHLIYTRFHCKKDHDIRFADKLTQA